MPRMNFRKDDIDTQLRYSDHIPVGVYDQLNWKVRTGADATDITSQSVSVHEFMHNELNNTSAYGCLLQAYAYLARESTPLQAQFNNILNELVEFCRSAHEVYATWMSINLLSTDIKNDLHKELLADNEEYIYYYKWAAEIVQSVPSLYLRRHIVTAVINICFQSQSITTEAAIDLVVFKPSQLNRNDFPTERLKFLTKNCMNCNWMDLLNEFAETQRQIPWYGLLRNAIEGNEDENALSNSTNETNSAKLITFIYDQLAAKLSSQGLSSLSYLEHLPYFKQLLPLLDKLAPFNQSANPLVINSQPMNLTRSTLQNFENETLLFTSRPLTCILLQPNDMSATTMAQVLAGVSEHPHIFVIGQTYTFMKEQYIFPLKEDAQWCEQGYGSFTAIRYAGLVGDQRVVICVPFSEPLELQNFLSDKPVSIPVLSAISETACNDVGWLQLWGDYFENNSASACILLDRSPLYYIEKVFCDAAAVLYMKMDIVMEDLVKSAMLFQIKNNDKTVALIAAPCSEIYARGLHHYIQTRFPLFKNKVDLSNEHLQNLSTIISHIFTEEHQHNFRSKSG